MSNTIRIAVAAAAVVIAAFVGLRLIAPPISPGNSPSPSPTATPAATPRPVISEGLLTPGTWYFTTVLPQHIVFDVPSTGWQKNVAPDAIWTSNSESRFAFSTPTNLPADYCNDAAGLRNPPLGLTVDDLATALATIPGLDPVTPSDVTLGGYSGKFLELNIPAVTEACGEVDLTLWDGTLMENQAKHRFWILDVQGTRLVIHAVERDGQPTVWRNEMQQIIDSIRIETP